MGKKREVKERKRGEKKKGWGVRAKKGARCLYNSRGGREGPAVVLKPIEGKKKKKKSVRRGSNRQKGGEKNAAANQAQPVGGGIGVGMRPNEATMKRQEPVSSTEGEAGNRRETAPVWSGQTHHPRKGEKKRDERRKGQGE